MLYILLPALRAFLGVGWGRRNYHPGQKKGDQTDYGEYNLFALEYFASRKKAGPVDLQELLPMWKDRPLPATHFIFTFWKTGEPL